MSVGVVGVSPPVPRRAWFHRAFIVVVFRDLSSWFGGAMRTVNRLDGGGYSGGCAPFPYHEAV